MRSDKIFADMDQAAEGLWLEMLGDVQIALALSGPPEALRDLSDAQLATIRRLAKVGSAYICANKMRVCED